VDFAPQGVPAYYRATAWAKPLIEQLPDDDYRQAWIDQKAPMSRAHHRHMIERREMRPHEFNGTSPARILCPEIASFSSRSVASRIESVPGDRKHDRRNWTEEENYVSCPKCRTKLAKAALKARPADAPKLTLERDPDARGGFRYKQGWRALVDGETVAILGFEEHSWHIYPLVVRRPDDEHPEVRVINSHGVLTESGTTASRGMFRLPNTALCFKTKEDALLAAGDLRRLWQAEDRAGTAHGVSRRSGRMGASERRAKRKDGRARSDESRHAGGAAGNPRQGDPVELPAPGSGQCDRDGRGADEARHDPRGRSGMTRRFNAKRETIPTGFGWTRQVEIDPDKVAAIRAHIRAGLPLPPVVVVVYGTTLLPLDGHHRTIAHALEGLRSTPTPCPAAPSTAWMRASASHAEDFIFCDGVPCMAVAAQWQAPASNC
jgi:hypothetical protein